KDLSKDKSKVTNVPLFEFGYADYKVFADDLKDAYKAVPSLTEVPSKIEADPEWFGPVFNTVLSLLLIVGVWVLLMRKMGGPTGGGGPG
ncbi:hypothetical protein ABTF39_20145, partial [Acinetobacter baumannii]